MKTKFDKIYCINFLPNKERREFMKYQFDQLDLDVEFYDAIDYSLIFHNLNNSSLFGCSESHYHCIKKSQLLGYNKILIIEDDVCFLKDKNKIEQFFNNLPEDWEYIKFVCTLCDFYNKQESITWNQYKMFNENYNNIPWIKLNDFDKKNYFGSNSSSCYALTKKTIDYCCNFYEHQFKASDQVKYLFSNINNSPFKSYTTNIPLMLPDCSFTLGKCKEIGIKPEFNMMSHIKFNNDDYFRPNNYLKSNIMKNIC